MLRKYRFRKFLSLTPAPGLAEVQATSLEDREVEHRDETAGVRHAHRAVPEEQAFAFSLRIRFPV